MKKLLLTSAACGLVLSAAPAHAEIDFDIGGYFKGYGAFVDQDSAPGLDTNDVDFIRDTEIHFTGETTLDNGLTVGFHLETAADGSDSFEVDESYAYFSGGWGRVNFGAEDGAGYLLQVAAPSADDNIDGIRQFVNPVNYTAMSGLSAAAVAANGVDYDMDPTKKADKLTYLSPIMNGFQVGVSFTPDSDGPASSYGIGFDDIEDTAGRSYEAAVRYEGQFNNVGVILGAGYAYVENEKDALTSNTVIGYTISPNAAGNAVVFTPVTGINSDDRQAWNVGADFDIGAFGIGAVYTQDDGGITGVSSDEEETIVVGVDYTTGPFKLGASYLNQENTYSVKGLDTDRYAGGVTYTYGPGMTFRGSVGYVEHDFVGNVSDKDATYVTLGTQINF